MHFWRWVALGLLIGLGAQAQPVTPAQRKEAATHYQRGVALSKDGDYAAALAEFRAAYQAAPSFEVLFNIGLCERRTFKYGQALRTFAEYLRQGGDKVPADRRKAVATEIEQVRLLTAPITVIVEGGPARVSVDGEPAGTTPLTEMLPLGPGKHVVRAEREGDLPEERTIEVVSGQAQAVQLSLKSLTKPVEVRIETKPAGALVSIDGAAPAPSPLLLSLAPGSHEVTARLDGHAPARTDVVVQPGQPRTVALELVALPPAQPGSGRFPVVGVSLLSAGLISGGLGIFFAVRANSTENTVTTYLRTAGAAWTDDWIKTDRAGREHQLAAQILLGAGGGLLAAGVVAIFVNALGPAEKPASPTAHFFLVPSPDGATAACSVSF